ncbi:MAG: hypothetical protein GY920_20455 [Aliivibrio sp.]|nr:hypothetical protein [Aliivibrio sp.]MCP4322162.1 hypothetical protein [Alteromonadales bacterium]
MSSGYSNMEKIRKKRKNELGKLGRSIKDWFSSKDSNKKKQKKKEFLDKEKVKKFKSGFFGKGNE